MMPAKTTTKGKYCLFTISFFVEKVKAEIVTRDCESEIVNQKKNKCSTVQGTHSMDQLSLEDGETVFEDQAMAVMREPIWNEAIE